MNHTEKEKSSQRIRSQDAYTYSHQQSMQKNLIKFVFSFLLFALTPILSFAQNITNVNNLYPLIFNTGINVSGSACTPVTPGSTDPNWKVSGGLTTFAPQALVVNPAPQGTFGCLAWTGNNTANPWSQWITAPSMTCGGIPSNYSCNVVNDLYFSNTYSFPTGTNTPIVQVNGYIWASDYVQNIILVNSAGTNTIWTSGASMTSTVGPFPCHRQNAVVFSWCNFKSGTNTIYVHVRRDPHITDSTCKTMGIKVMTYANFSTSTISGSPNVCAGNTYTYSFPPKSTFGLGSVTPTTYSWTPINTWPTLGTNSLVSTVAGNVSGILACSLYSLNANGAYCISTGGYSITVPPPLTLTPVSATLCSGKSLTISANPSGAGTYSFYGPPGTLLYSGPVNTLNVTPSLGPSTYTVKVTTGGCVYTKTLMVNTFQTPNVSVSPSSTSICKGDCSTLTIGGTGWHYFITPCGSSTVPCQIFTWTPQPFCPTITTNYCITDISIQGCTNIACTNIVVNTTPTVSATANPSVICIGGGAVCTLLASGATSYVWHTVPAPIAVNPKTVAPTSATCYTATGTVGACTANAVACVTTIAAPQIIVNPPVICSGMSNTLTASGGNNYVWTFPIGATYTASGNSATIIATSPTPYTVCGTGANSCSSCTTGTITMGSPIPLTVPNLTYCTNSNPCTTITASSSLTVPITYTWTSGTTPSIAQTVTICPTVPGTYQVNASSTVSGCPSSATMSVSIVSNCCAQPTTGLTQLGTSIGGNYSNNSYVLNNSTTLTTSAFFANAEVWITEGVSITIPTGFQMQLDKTHLFGCGTKMWQGIIVQDGGRINTVNTRTVMSMIEDAVIAIQLDQISQTNASPNLPIDIARIMFNRNYIGIKISNSVPTLTVLPLGINGCVFTSRNLPFTTYPLALTWPNNDCQITTGALRFPTSPTTNLTPPYGYMVTNYTAANLKIPYTFQPAHIGIKIENIGDPNSTGAPTFSNSGVEFGISNPGPISNDFNLFENIGHGIDVADASLTTARNVFQNLRYYYTGSAWFGGKGINHMLTVGSARVARLDLRGGANNFWDCNIGVNAINVPECWTSGSVFRSTQSVVSAFAPPQVAQGDIGVNYESEGFNFTVENSEFNNLRTGIIFRTPQVLNQLSTTGEIQISGNYFGPETKSTNPYSSATPNTSEYMNCAIDIGTPNTANWQTSIGTSLIVSNKIHRSFNGILVDGYVDSPLTISTNSVHLEDDATYNQGQYGIAIKNNLGQMSVISNSVDVATIWNSATGTVAAFYCISNSGTGGSPLISCNNQTGSRYGFEFEGYNGSTIWQGNTLCSNKYGLALVNNGVIGQQGTSSLSNNNIWSSSFNAACVPWGVGAALYETYCENSSPVLSPLYVYNSPSSVPANNLSVPSGSQYKFTAPQSLFYAASRINDCPATGPFTAPPSWRMMHSATLTAEETEFSESNIKLFPNPTNGSLKISGTKEALSVSVFDLAGKLVFYQEKLDTESSIDLSNLSASIYFIELKNAEGKAVRKKLIKTE